MNIFLIFLFFFFWYVNVWYKKGRDIPSGAVHKQTRRKKKQKLTKIFFIIIFLLFWRFYDTSTGRQWQRKQWKKIKKCVRKVEGKKLRRTIKKTLVCSLKNICIFGISKTRAVWQLLKHFFFSFFLYLQSPCSRYFKITSCEEVWGEEISRTFSFSTFIAFQNV